MEIKHIKLNNGEMEYFSFGNGKQPLLIIPGLSLHSVMLSADAVANAYKDFGKCFTVYVFDHIKDIHKNYSIKDMADNIAFAAKELGISSACVFAVSHGGMIAQQLTISHPQLVSKLALGSTVCRMNEMSRSVISKWVALANSGNAFELNSSIFEHLYSKELLCSIGDSLLKLKKQGTREEMERFSILAKSCLNFDVTKTLCNINCKVMVIAASNDRVLSFNGAKELSELLNCEMVVFEGEHAVYDEDPNYKKVLLDFFL